MNRSDAGIYACQTRSRRPRLIRYLSECKTVLRTYIMTEAQCNATSLLAAFIAFHPNLFRYRRTLQPRPFIADNFSSRQELIEYIKQVDNSPELTAAYQNAPPILPNSPLHNLHPDKIKPVFLSLAERALEQAQRPPHDPTHTI